jgi:hypothetical protein
VDTDRLGRDLQIAWTVCVDGAIVLRPTNAVGWKRGGGRDRRETVGRGKVGALMSAQQGVLQITERNSTDTSGCGTYDTSTIGKTAKAVVTLEYAIESGK